jgi:hypothetical protein
LVVVTGSILVSRKAGFGVSHFSGYTAGVHSWRRQVGMALQYFTLVHILISLVGIASGFGVLSGLMAGKLFRRWTAVFLATTAATSVTGFFFPFNGLTPGIAVGVLSLVALAVAYYALYGRRPERSWRRVFVISAVLSLYFNFFVLVVQFFQKTPALVEIAPTLTEAPFATTQGVVLIAFVVLAIAAVRRFDEQPGRTSDSHPGDGGGRPNVC